MRSDPPHFSWSRIWREIRVGFLIPMLLPESQQRYIIVLFYKINNNTGIFMYWTVFFFLFYISVFVQLLRSDRSYTRIMHSHWRLRCSIVLYPVGRTCDQCYLFTIHICLSDSVPTLSLHFLSAINYTLPMVCVPHCPFCWGVLQLQFNSIMNAGMVDVM